MLFTIDTATSLTWLELIVFHWEHQHYCRFYCLLWLWCLAYISTGKLIPVGLKYYATLFSLKIQRGGRYIHMAVLNGSVEWICCFSTSCLPYVWCWHTLYADLSWGIIWYCHFSLDFGICFPELVLNKLSFLPSDIFCKPPDNGWLIRYL